VRLTLISYLHLSSCQQHGQAQLALCEAEGPLLVLQQPAVGRIVSGAFEDVEVWYTDT
jgi:hypothetical protein